MGDNARASRGSKAHSEGVGIIGPVRVLTVPSHVELEPNLHVWGYDPGTIYTGLTVLRHGRGNSFSTSIHAHNLDDSWVERGISMMLALQTYLGCITLPRGGSHLIVGLEMPSVYGGHGNVAVKLGDIRGMIVGLMVSNYMYMREMGDRLHFYPNIQPGTLKKALTGYGRASKAQMIAEAQKWNRELVLPDEADSIGVALVALRRYREEHQ